MVAVHVFDKLGRTEVPEADAGDIVALVGLPDPKSATRSPVPSAGGPPANQRRRADAEDGLSVNTSPLAGRDGKYVTSRHLRDAADARAGDERRPAGRARRASTDSFTVSGRGMLHLSVLIETMRREGYELSIGKPQVIRKRIDGALARAVRNPAWSKSRTTDMGAVMELVGERRGTDARDGDQRNGA